jgi:hypothetical protein
MPGLQLIQQQMHPAPYKVTYGFWIARGFEVLTQIAGINIWLRRLVNTRQPRRSCQIALNSRHACQALNHPPGTTVMAGKDEEPQKRVNGGQ